MAGDVFDPFTTELSPGINLLEASAGTGKTYAIAMLVLRFVVEQNVDIKELLVVTFTKAATEELKSRIRDRLSEAKQVLQGTRKESDSALSTWLEMLPLPTEVITRRLAQALLDIDQASIFTIHGFCQRMLSEHALESGQLFDCELTGDIAVIKQACADDFWRRTLYRRNAWEVSVLSGEFSSPDALMASVASIAEDQPLFPHYIDLDTLLAELRGLSQTIARQLPSTLARIRSALGEGKFKSSYSLPENSEAWLSWLNAQSVMLPDFSPLTEQGLLDALNGHKFRKSKSNPLSSEEQKKAYINQLGIESEPFNQLEQLLGRIRLHFRLALLHELRKQLSVALKQQNLFSFDDLISSLADVLRGDDAMLLSSELQRRFKAALIDEFQDTDPHQWFIFSTLFSMPEQSLYLIGDPKQAIYKFRGADIYSYFEAQQQAGRQFSLGKNWRSHPHLVDGVNQLFRRQQPFLFQQPEFLPVQPAKNAVDGTLYQDGKPLEPLLLWQLQPYSDNQAYWSAGKAAETIRGGVVDEIVALLNRPAVIKTCDSERAVRPGDIAVLVRTNPQAREYQQALAVAGVPSVLNSKESVFASPQATALYTVLKAISQPGNIPLLKQALMVNWFGLDGQALYCLGDDEIGLEAWVVRFQDYLQCWQRNGLMSMLQRLVRCEEVAIILSRLPQAERQLTDLNHLTELLQQAAIEEHLGINKTLDWLHLAIAAIADGGTVGDEQQLRLESDEDAVRIVTMHGAKGLEYPVVFCPYLWQRSERLKRAKNLVICHEDGRMIADLGSEQFERRKQQALQEELAEDLRLCYVAVTRAKYRCYINWADVRSKQQANDSALAYLFDFSNDDFAAQRQKLQSLDDGKIFAHRLLKTDHSGERRYCNDVSLGKLESRVFHRNLFTDWQMSSYTALSSLSLQEAPELPVDKADEQMLLIEVSDDAEQLPKGAHTGNVLHELLENISFSVIAAEEDITTQIDNACLKYGLNLERPELIDDLLHAVVSTPLAADPEFRLSRISDQHCLKEMPFYLALEGLDVSQINEILQYCPAYQTLDRRQMSGYLTGFIDLVCEFDGRFFLMDYKSNSLDDYRPDCLVRAMREHNYGLQYWIYTLVLHRYLKLRLADYDYERHFGGVKYLFLRGMQPNIPGSGVYSDRPELRTIRALETLFFNE